MGTIKANKPIIDFTTRHIYDSDYQSINSDLYEIPKSVTGELVWQDSTHGNTLTIVSDKYLNDFNKPICRTINQTQNKKKREYLLSGLEPNICQ